MIGILGFRDNDNLYEIDVNKEPIYEDFSIDKQLNKGQILIKD